ncbi:MAG: magnesium chelatase [Acidobacteria bacterium 13_1_20CM_2_55_15]|nr:MAG: magnesium chelatase [Acidobacteria bacterium 13_1_20CM_2_55_15]
MTPSEAGVQPLLADLKRSLAEIIEGQDSVIDNVIVSLAAGGHALIEGVPGVAKTLLARSLASAVRGSFSRIQFTPDLMPADITGVNVFEPKAAEFRFRPGPLFADVVLADEINRAPAKTQAALLEAMQEGQVTIDGATHVLSPMLTVLATQNPIEYEGTYPLPEAQLDRFMMKIIVGYPALKSERLMITRMHQLGDQVQHPEKTVKAVLTPAQLLEIRSAAHRVEVDESIINYIVEIIRNSRTASTLSLGASPRAGVMLLRAAKAIALVRGKSYVTPDEVRDVLFPVLRHRVRLTPEAEIEGLTADACLESLAKRVAVPR